MQKWYLSLVCLIILLLPTNLFFKIALPHAYVHGLLVDYLIPKIYLSDLPILGLLLSWLWEMRTQLRLSWPKNPHFSWVKTSWLTLILLLVMRQFFTENPLASLWFLAKLIEMVGLAAFLLTHRQLLAKPIWWGSLLFSICFQGLVGIKQFYTQTSFSQGYIPFGEVNLRHSLGLAKDNYFGTSNILAYGTTPHPNMLAGFMVIGTLLFFRQAPTKLWPCKISLILLTIWLLILTQSISASLSFILGLGLISFEKELRNWLTARHTKKMLGMLILLSALVFIPISLNYGAKKFPLNQSFTRRDTLNRAAVNMISHQPLFGVGLNNFTQQLELYSSSREIVAFVQPVHNVAFLWLAETGLIGVGVLIFSSLMSWKWRKIVGAKHSSVLIVLLVLLPILSLDHYLLSQQLGMLLIVFFLTQFMGWEKV